MTALWHSFLRISLLVFCSQKALGSSWKDWWNYEGFSGPDFWGLQTPEWRMCAYGKQQSPIDINPSNLLYDPQLPPLSVDKLRLSGNLENTGQQLVLNIDNDVKKSVVIQGGPLGAYVYKIAKVFFHFGAEDNRGSEHTIAGERFAGEMQFLAYNSRLYDNFSHAMTNPHGLAAISSMIDIGPRSNGELMQITTASSQVYYKGQKTPIKSFSPFYSLPQTGLFVTYEGSLTYPGCHETVTWMVLNKPSYITINDLKKLRDLQRSEQKQINPIYLADNFRPLHKGNGRLLRTNIKLQTRGSDRACNNLMKDMYYKKNPFRKSNNVAVTKRDTWPWNLNDFSSEN